jgi:hypothetical protein
LKAWPVIILSAFDCINELTSPQFCWDSKLESGRF